MARKYLIWIAIPGVIFLTGLILFLNMGKPPTPKAHEIGDKIAPFDVVIIINAGGRGNVMLEQATDFLPILEGIQQNLTRLGYSSILIPYTRTPPGISNEIFEAREQLTSYKKTSQVQANDILELTETYPDKKFIIAGFSNGGGLTGSTMKRLQDRPNIYALSGGIPCWYRNFRSTNSLVLNNDGKDPLATCDLWEIIVTVVKAPFRWIWARLTGEYLKLAQALNFPGHDYSWSIPAVHAPVIHFLETHFPQK